MKNLVALEREASYTAQVAQKLFHPMEMAQAVLLHRIGGLETSVPVFLP